MDPRVPETGEDVSERDLLAGFWPSNGRTLGEALKRFPGSGNALWSALAKAIEEGQLDEEDREAVAFGAAEALRGRPSPFSPGTPPA